MSEKPTVPQPIPEDSEEQLDALAASSPVLKRLIEEVRLERLTPDQVAYGTVYNRTYNRHMRS
jgi:hypothetical protein